VYSRLWGFAFGRPFADLKGSLTLLRRDEVMRLYAVYFLYSGMPLHSQFKYGINRGGACFHAELFEDVLQMFADGA